MTVEELKRVANGNYEVFINDHPFHMERGNRYARFTTPVPSGQDLHISLFNGNDIIGNGSAFNYALNFRIEKPECMMLINRTILGNKLPEKG